MKDDIRRQRIRERRRTHDVSNVNLKVLCIRRLILHSSEGPFPVFRCVAHKDGTIIALAGPGQLWYIVYQKGTYTGIPCQIAHNDYARGLIRVHDGLAISVGHDGLMISSFFNEPWSSFEKQYSRRLVSLAALSDTEFVVGDENGVLCFYKHRNGKEIQLIHSIPGVHRRWVSWIAVHDNFMVTVSECSTACVWDISTRKRVAMLPHASSVWQAAMNEHLIATVSFQDVRVFRNGSGYRLSHVFKGLNQNLGSYCVEVVGDNLLLTAGMGSLITVTSLSMKMPIICVSTTLPYIQDLTLTPNGWLIASSNMEIPDTREGDSTQFEASSQEMDRCAIVEFARKHGVKKELMKEARKRFGTSPNEINWKSGAVALVATAVVLCIRRIMCKK